MDSLLPLTEQAFDPRQIDHVIMSMVIVTSRILALFYVSPFFAGKTMPRTVRIGLTVALSFVVIPAPFAAFEADPSLGDRFLPLVVKEVVIGIVLGMLIWMPVRGLELAGVILDTQRGSTQAQDMDPLFGASLPPTAILLNQMFSGYFFSSGGFLIVLMLIFNSFAIWPPTAALPPLSGDAAYLFIKFSGLALFAAIIFVLPISGLMVLADIVIAFLARSATTLNALTFGMPVKTAIMLLVLAFYIQFAYPRVLETLADALALTEEVFGNER